MRQNGRDLKILMDGTVIAAVNTKSMTVDLQPVDVTSDDDEGFATFLDRPGRRAMSLEVGGFVTDTILRDLAFGGGAGGSVATPFGMQWMDAATGITSVAYEIEGNFIMSNYTESGDTEGAIGFTATFQSSGPFNTVTA